MNIVFALGFNQPCFHSENILNYPAAPFLATLGKHFVALITQCWHCFHTHTVDESLQRQTADQSSKKKNFHLETLRVQWPPLVSLFLSLLTHKWSLKPNPPVITTWGNLQWVALATEAVMELEYLRERERERCRKTKDTREWKDSERKRSGNWCRNERMET